MKRYLTLLVVGFFAASGYSQTVILPEEGATEFVRCAHFQITPPLRDLAELMPEYDDKDDPRVIHNNRLAFPAANPNALPQGLDPVAQLEMGQRMFHQRAPLVQWNGLNGATPPDPSGAAGPDHYMQAVNTSYKVYSKTGGTITATASLSSLWSGSLNSGDPIVMYDRHADRWFISQFQTSGTWANGILIAVSTTSDPAGTYYAYTFVPVSNQFPDYPKFSIWSDGYYMTANYSTKRIVVFDRSKILAGDPTAGMLIRPMPSTPSNGFFCALPADADGQLPPAGTPCPVFSFEDDAWASGSVDRIRVYKVACDWTAQTIDFTLDQLLPAQPFNSVFTASWNDIEQPGTTQKLDAIAGVLTYRAQYIRWAGYNTVTLCHVVKVNQTTGQAGIRWYELRQDQSTGTWSIFQEGTYAPTTESRWCGSIAMDEQGNIGMAYAVSGSSTFPSIRYTGRLATDPLGQMTFMEQTAATGTSSQTSANRFGDYSQTTLDPDGLTFWHTGQYISSGRKTRIFSFRIAGAAGTEELAKGDIQVFQNGNTLVINASDLPNEKETMVDLFDLQGRQILATKVFPVQQAFSQTLHLGNIVPAAYLVRIGNNDFQRVVKVVVQ